ncbi:PDR/VanB family oxidoreductase [Rheinheimera sp. UJ63]|uniref:PDR/VanB family oxidoreductase n=1 Tax=Rheinheimera sp. UJ63 TaxID=2910157 RepID=UPI001F2B2905|nr:PDR/VanB family oxidoreductase [Rheinheimera sp. UJ63]MCF4010003.1 PDR/VanB family oxidoreductase [Rheinheimera sp. UJ63]
MLNVKILKRTQEALDIVSFELGNIDGSALPHFDAGAHIDVQINENTLRQYSLYNSSNEHRTYKIAVLRDANSRGGSQWIHDTLKQGDIIKISHPRNLFSLNTGRHPVLLFAGGIGITPLISMAETLHSLNQAFELHYFARSKEHAAFFSQLANGPFSKNVFFHFEDLRASQGNGVRDILTGRQTDITPTQIYTCGPNGFMDFIFSTAKELGWPISALHKEVFKADIVEPSTKDKCFTLNLIKSGITIDVSADQTALEALEEAGVEIDSSCEQGVCGSCLTKVLNGVPDHRDHFLSDSERSANDQFTPCCSRALSESLSLDL